MSKRKAYESDLDELIESMTSSLVLDNNEYDLLMTAYESKITDIDIVNIIEAAARRYVRYLRAEIFKDYQHIETSINRYLQKHETMDLEVTFKDMKEIDGLIIAAIEDEASDCDRKRARMGECECECECEGEYEDNYDSMDID